MSQIQEVKDANNIVEIIGERINLQISGTSLKACCPFHNEKTPSFFVHPEMQRYRCFGCGATGDVLDFLQNYEGMTFYEALKVLADRSGIALKEFSRSQEDEEREQLLAILNLAKEYYHYLLTEHEAGESARQYLKDRATTGASIKLFQLGVSLDSWDGLIKYLHVKKKYALDLIAKTGLIIEGRGGRYYDRFRGRLMFPLKNHRGQVVGFSGRVLDKDTKEAKYINSPETLLYHKSKMLYGYSELFREIKKAEKVVVVEGEFDMISSTQAHLNYVVAIKGSALTAEQIELLARVAKTIILSLDADAAGIQATQRAIDLVKNREIDLRVIDLKHLVDLENKELKDPDDLARAEPKRWREAVEGAISVYEYLMNVAFDQHNAQAPDGQRQIINDLAPIIREIPHAVEKEFYLQKLAQKLNVRLSLLKEDIERFGQVKKTVNKKSETEKATLGPVKSHLEKLEEYLFFILFKLTEDEFVEAVKQIADINWQSLGAKQIIKSLQKQLDNYSFEKFSQSLADDLKKLLMDWVLNPEHETGALKLNLKKEWQNTLNQVKKEILNLEIELTNQEITQLEKKLKPSSSEESRLEELSKQVNELLKQKIILQRQIKN